MQVPTYGSKLLTTETDANPIRKSCVQRITRGARYTCVMKLSAEVDSLVLW